MSGGARLFPAEDAREACWGWSTEVDIATRAGKTELLVLEEVDFRDSKLLCFTYAPKKLLSM